MTKFIDFVPKRPKNTVIAHPVKVAPKTSKSTPVTPKSVKKPAPAKATPVKLTFKPAKKPAPVKPVAKPAPKSTPKPSPKPSPVPRPIVNRGLRIDFVRKAPAKTPGIVAITKHQNIFPSNVFIPFVSPSFNNTNQSFQKNAKTATKVPT